MKITSEWIDVTTAKSKDTQIINSELSELMTQKRVGKFIVHEFSSLNVALGFWGSGMEQVLKNPDLISLKVQR